MPKGQSRTSLLKQVRNPLTFFALALLVIEGVIGTFAAIGLREDQRFYALCLMAALFVIVVGLVAWITFWRPQNLYDDVAELKEVVKGEGFRDVIEDVIIRRIKPECRIEQEPVRYDDG